tara:strand:- start:1945 stop:2769 length:825 start_codon:yes stop_codon:yes gene_type:complete
MNQSFVKYSALGNDYIVVDPNFSDIEITEESIKNICDRHNGPGSDGILYGPTSLDDLTLRIFNPDGSECEKSGNGIRIFSNYLYDNNYVNTSPFELKLRDEDIVVTPINASDGIFKVRMGKVRPGRLAGSEYPHSFVGREISFEGSSFTGSFIDVGNPHMVLETSTLDTETVKSLGPYISNHEMFVNRTNVQFCRILDPSNIEIEIYERGAGYTLASGSSSCAAVAALYLQGKVENEVKVSMPGGDLLVEIDSENYVYLIGSSKFIYSGNLGRK